jgi:hypothetical protein
MITTHRLFVTGIQRTWILTRINYEDNTAR